MTLYQPKNWSNRTPYEFALKRFLFLGDLGDMNCNENNEEWYYRILEMQEKYFSRFSAIEGLELFRGMILDPRTRKFIDPDGTIFTNELENEILNDPKMAEQIIEFMKEQGFNRTSF